MPKESCFKTLFQRSTSPALTREAIERMTMGLIKAKTLANLDYQGLGPKNRFRCGRKVLYPIESVIEFLESRSAEI